MSSCTLKRSTTGCLTCKQRKKKCDELKPVCRRCSNGNFLCLGYDSPGNQEGPYSDYLNERVDPNTTSTRFVLLDLAQNSQKLIVEGLTPPHGLVSNALRGSVDMQKRTLPSISISKPLQIPQPDAIHEMVPLIMKHYRNLIRHIVFRPPAMSLEDVLQGRVIKSEVVRWSMYIGARIIEDIANGENGQRYVNWIARLYQRIMDDSALTGSDSLDKARLHSRMAGIHELDTWVFVLLGTSAGYALLRNSASLFLRLVALFPEVWSDHATISIPTVLQIRRYELRNFIFQDVLSALALGIPMIVVYDVSAFWAEERPHPLLEWVYGFPAGIVLLLAKINSWRTLQCVSDADSSQSEWQLVEEQLQNWSPNVDQSDEASDYITRLAVQECWRQAALIYLYMGMCQVNSDDLRVQSAVHQVVQLAITIAENNPLRIHLFIPCLIAGVAARREKHRAIIRNKISVARDVISFILRETDFIPVLKHLWHGPASEGRPITWQDYVQSRCAVLPIS